jgi:hypothetical protein
MQVPPKRRYIFTKLYGVISQHRVMINRCSLPGGVRPRNGRDEPVASPAAQVTAARLGVYTRVGTWHLALGTWHLALGTVHY